MPQPNEHLLNLFRTHGLEAVLQDDWLTFLGRNLSANASVAKSTEQPHGISIQLDVRLRIAPRRTIVESFGGMGETQDEALRNAFENFTNSFHVFLAAFFGFDDDQVSREDWSVGGRECRVVIGNAGIRGKPPVQGEQLVAWFQDFERALKETQLRPGTNWVRMYYAQMEGKSMACEVLLNNVVWDEMQARMVTVDWPAGEHFYSVRILLVLEVAKGGSVTAESAVAWLADTVAEWNDFAEDDVRAALEELGVPEALADRALAWTQVAWGRVLLTDLGVSFSPRYLCFDAFGDVVESGDLADEPCFVAASRLADRYAGAPGFRQLATMSAEVNAVNNALHAGSKAHDLAMAPPCMFLDRPTPRGMHNAQRVLAEHMRSLGGRTSPEDAVPAPRKTWWRFWQ